MWNEARKEKGGFPVGYLIITCALAIIGILLYVYLNPDTGGQVYIPSSADATQQTSEISLVEEKIYINTVQAIAASCVVPMQVLGQLLQQYQPFNDEWVLSTSLEIYNIKMAAEDARTVNPPGSMIHIHEKFMLGMESFDDAMDLLVVGIDDVDANKIDQAGIMMEAGADYISEASELLISFKSAHGLE